MLETQVRNIVTLWHARDLLYMLTRRDVSIRYKQSAMGFLWAILMPILIIGAGALVRVGISHVTGKDISAEDIARVMVRAVVWAFVVSSIRFGTNSLSGNTNLVSKMAFPKETFPLAAILAAGIDFFVSVAALFVALLLLGWTPPTSALWAIPLTLVTFAMVTGITVFLSAANLFYRDVKYLVEVFLTYAIFFTPVLYDTTMFGRWANVIRLNPLAPLLEGFSDTVVDGRPPDWAWTCYSAAVASFVLFFGYAAFKRLESRFAENV